jgi:hypothetical protein
MRGAGQKFTLGETATQNAREFAITRHYQVPFCAQHKQVFRG